MNRVSAIEVLILVTGIVAAIAAGISGYRIVGPYGDGPFGGGFHRELDPRTGESTIFRERQTSQGLVRYIADESFRIRTMRIDSNRDGVIDSIIGFDTARTTATIDNNNDGTIDRWEHYDSRGALLRIGSSTRGDGIEDCWSYLDGDSRLAKVETDLNRDGAIDKREIFGGSPDGIRRVLLAVESEFDTSGNPGIRIRYKPDGSFGAREILRTPSGFPK